MKRNKNKNGKEKRKQVLKNRVDSIQKQESSSGVQQKRGKMRGKAKIGENQVSLKDGRRVDTIYAHLMGRKKAEKKEKKTN